MKFLIFSDIHIHNFKQFGYFSRPGINTRAEHHLNVLDQVVSTARTKDVSGTVFCGDLFDRGNGIDVSLIVETRRRIRDLCDVAPLLAIPGNHDYSSGYRSGDCVTSLDLFSDIPGFTVLDRNPYVIGNCEFFGIHAYDTDEDIPKGSEERFSVLIMHVIFREISSSFGTVSERNSRSAEQIAEQMKRNNIDICISGDYHERSVLYDRIYYAGSCLDMNFSPYVQSDKGIHILDTETARMTFVPVDYPRFITKHDPDEEEINDILSDGFNYYRVIVGSRDVFEDVSSMLKNRKNVVVVMNSGEGVGGSSPDHRLRSDVSVFSPLKDSFMKYAEMNSLDDDTVDEGIRILDKVSVEVPD